jgi:DNA mismatch repair protein MutL
MAVRQPQANYSLIGSVDTVDVQGKDEDALRQELFRERPSSLEILGQIHKSYLVCASSRGLILIDQHAAHERVLFQRLKREMDREQPAVQGLLFPETLELSPMEWNAVQRFLPSLRRIGFDLEPFGRNTLITKSVPSILGGGNHQERLSDLIRDLVEEEKGGGSEEPIERVLKTTACHGAIRSGQTLSREEMARLLEDMEGERFFHTCPHGRPVWVEIGLDWLEKRFMRTS